MDRNEGAKRCCIRLGCGLRSESLNHRLMDPDQLTTPQATTYKYSKDLELWAKSFIDPRAPPIRIFHLTLST